MANSYIFEYSLGKLSHEISIQLGRQLDARFRKRGFAIRARDWLVISYLYNLGDQSQQDLVELIKDNKVAIKRTIDRLQANNIVERETWQQDKRYNRVKLSMKGQELYPQLAKIAQQVLEDAAAGISQSQMQECIVVLQKVAANFDGTAS
jgi:DNA-binding MarR family transcriptional regulator